MQLAQMPLYREFEKLSLMFYNIYSSNKPHRIYISNRTVNRCEAKVNWFCRQNKDFKNKNAELFVSVINSYFGLMRHYSSYKIRERISEAILSKWGDVLYFANNYNKAIIKQQYKKRQILTKTLKLSL
jgi:RNA-directed DNA polymerase